MDHIANAKVYKKTSSNSVLTLYMGSRDLVFSDGVVEPLRGVIVCDPKFLSSQKIYGQLTLTFRYGREDEEVMGLKFCNEVVVALKQLWPRRNYNGEITVLQQALVERLGAGAHPFQIDVGTIAAPSVQLLPAKKYSGDPIGTSYDVRIFMSDLADEKLQGRTSVKLGIRVIYKIPTNFQSIQESNLCWKANQKNSFRSRLSPKIQRLCSRTKQQKETSKSTTAINNSEALKNANTNIPPERVKTDFFKSGEEGPESCAEKLFLWTEGRVSLKSSLDKCAYKHGETVCIKVHIRNSSRKVVRKIRIIAVQHVDVCMFSNGKFKNIVGEIIDSNHIKCNETFSNTYNMIPVIGSTKNWIAVESKLPHAHLTATDFLATNNYKLASSTFQDNLLKERNVFAIYVTYYIKIKLSLSALGGDLSLKLPFVLGYVGEDSNESSTRRNSEKQLDVLISRKIPLNRTNSKVKKEVKVSENVIPPDITTSSEPNEIYFPDGVASPSHTPPHPTSIQVEIHREN